MALSPSNDVRGTCEDPNTTPWLQVIYNDDSEPLKSVMFKFDYDPKKNAKVELNMKMVYGSDKLKPAVTNGEGQIL